MRVVVPYTKLHPITDTALHDYAPEAERVEVSGSDYAYATLLAQLWRDGRSFLLVEHDIEINAEIVAQARDCDCRWGRSFYPYSVGTDRASPLVASLGCVRFSSALLAETRDLFDEIGCPPWGLLDQRFFEALNRRRVVAHDHAPVGHHHWQPVGVEVPRCTCGSLTEDLCPSNRHHADAGCGCTSSPTGDKVPRVAPEPLRAVEYAGVRFGTAAMPATFRCSDGELYVVKAPGAGWCPHSPHALAVEQIVGRLGAAVGAPVAPGCTIVELTEQAIASGGEETEYLRPGLASATRYLPDCEFSLYCQAPQSWLGSPEGARLEGLLSWLGTGSYALQLLQTPRGDFRAIDAADLRPQWPADAPEPRWPVDAFPQRGTDAEIAALERAMSDVTIAAALGAIPDAWMTRDERTSLARYFAKRRDAMLRRLRLDARKDTSGGWWECTDGGLIHHKDPQETPWSAARRATLERADAERLKRERQRLYR